MDIRKKDYYLIIHGHFYQPPREDPWTGRIDRQDSAYPYHDWNQRINSECYSANTDARTLNRFGQIKHITNNYSYISFNFGPTLLNWLETEDPETYWKIIEADEESLKHNNGHGNAIAQVYNHMILPLSNTNDKITQVLWGLYDFKKRFGRDSEGIWLAETAVNMATVDVLIEYGIKFIILSPTQADSVFNKDSNTWDDVSNNSINTSKAYYIKRKKGKIAVFFYDMDISKSVGFEHLLVNSDNFRDRILSVFEPGEKEMVNIATDGESYGHHEPFANMCLSSLIIDNDTNHYFKMTNYGFFLEKFPPEVEVRLKEGNNGLGTAWSCAHGVGRWMEDCGCSGGQLGWDQKWRAPLRRAFDFLRDELAHVSEKYCSNYFKDFSAARNEYIKVVMDNTEEMFDSFVKEHCKGVDDPNVKVVVRALMEAQKYSMFMYTSCGWFFSDISGIETVQCIRYAAKVFEIASAYLPEDTEDRFVDILSEARSNISHFQNGAKVYNDFVKKYILDECKVVNQFIVEYFLTGELTDGTMYFYNVEIEDEKIQDLDGVKIFSGIAHLTNNALWETKSYIFYLIRFSHLDIISYIKSFSDPRFKEYIDLIINENKGSDIKKKLKEWFVHSYSLIDMKIDYKEKLVSELFKSLFVDLHSLRNEKMSDYIVLLNYYAKLNISIPEVERASLESVLNTEISYQLALLDSDEEGADFELVSTMLKCAKRTNLKINHGMVEAFFAIKIRQIFDDYFLNKEQNDYYKLIKLIDFANMSELDFNRKKMENLVYDILSNEIMTILKAEDRKEFYEKYKYIEQMLHIGEVLNIQVTNYNKLYSECLMEMENGNGKN